MNIDIPQPRACFPTASTCTKILIDFILAPRTNETERDKKSLAHAPVKDDQSTSKTRSMAPDVIESGADSLSGTA
jgi:hypothetical protein